jgi:hypothetical protein
MKRETLTTWTDKDGGELLRIQGNKNFYIPLSTIDRERLIELKDACEDAIKLTEPPAVAVAA